jgi:hypothetical protein
MARLNARKLDYSDADFSVYRKVKRMYQPVKEKHIKIDTSRMSSLEICIGGYSVETNKILKIFHHPNLAKLVEQFPYKLKLYFLFVEAKTYVQQKTEFSISIFVRSNLLCLRN